MRTPVLQLRHDIALLRDAFGAYRVLQQVPGMVNIDHIPESLAAEDKRIGAAIDALTASGQKTKQLSESYASLARYRLKA